VAELPPIGLHENVKGPVPLATEATAVPSLPPKHVTFVVDIMVTLGPVASFTLIN
jgi:hypothetical protein